MRGSASGSSTHPSRNKYTAPSLSSGANVASGVLVVPSARGARQRVVPAGRGTSVTSPPATRNVVIGQFAIRYDAPETLISSRGTAHAPNRSSVQSAIVVRVPSFTATMPSDIEDHTN